MQKVLNQDFNRMMEELTSGIEYTASDYAPNTYEDLIASTQASQMIVWSGASEATIFGDAKLNHMFRAWHDVKHIEHELLFTPQGEAMACHYQQLDVLNNYGENDYTKLFNKILDIEINKQIEYFETNGHFVVDQLAFAQNLLNKQRS